MQGYSIVTSTKLPNIDLWTEDKEIHCGDKYSLVDRLNEWMLDPSESGCHNTAEYENGKAYFCDGRILSITILYNGITCKKYENAKAFYNLLEESF